MPESPRHNAVFVAPFAFDDVIPTSTIDPIKSETAKDSIVLGSAKNLIRIVVASQQVVASTANERIGSIATSESIGSAPTCQRVITGTTKRGRHKRSAVGELIVTSESGESNRTDSRGHKRLTCAIQFCNDVATIFSHNGDVVRTGTHDLNLTPDQTDSGQQILRLKLIV